MVSGTVAACVASAGRVAVTVGGATYEAQASTAVPLQLAGFVREGAVHALLNGAYCRMQRASQKADAPAAPAASFACGGGAHAATCGWDDVRELARAVASQAGAFTPAPDAAVPAAPNPGQRAR
jgi:hypothetical protein